jgi:signal transduction histidine kinase
MKLFTRGLLLIALPSAVELALLGAVFDTQQQTAQAVARSAHSKQILYQAAALEDPLLSRVAQVRAALIAGDAAQVARHAPWADLQNRLAQLERLIADNPGQLARVARMRATLDSCRVATDAVIDALSAGRSAEALASLEGQPMPAPVGQFLEQLSAFIDEASQRDQQRSGSLSRSRERQQLVLIAAVVGSMLIWTMTAVIYARSIGRRFEVLTRHAEQLGSGEPLTSPLGGNDEIAALDSTLHQTSARLRAAEQEQVLLQQRLQARAAELAEVNEALRQETQDNEMFIYSVSHDLRSPLVNLQGFSRELQLSCDDLRATIDAAALPEAETRRLSRVLDGDMRESLRYLRESVLRSAAIIEALLRISRVGRLDYQWQRLNIGEIVVRVVNGLQTTIRERAALVTVRDLPGAWGDPQAIEQVFGHLIGNALTFLDPARPGRIEVGALAASDSVRTAQLASDGAGMPPRSAKTRTYYVRDNGLGIPAGCLPKMFAAFQRLHGDLSQGEGIGLALVRRTVERHGGRVWVESAEGAGSTFFVVLPDQPIRAF